MDTVLRAVAVVKDVTGARATVEQIVPWHVVQPLYTLLINAMGLARVPATLVAHYVTVQQNRFII